MSSIGESFEAFEIDRTKSGLTLLEGWIDQGYVAGLNGTLRTRPVSAQAGEVEFVCDVDERHANFVGLVHGGVGAALVDIAGGAAAMTLLEPGQTLLTTDLDVRYLQPSILGAGALIARGRCTYSDKRKVVVEVLIRCDDTVVVAGSASIAIRPASGA